MKTPLNVTAACVLAGGTLWTNAQPTDRPGVRDDPGPAVAEAIRTAVHDGRLGVFAGATGDPDAWGDVCVGWVRGDPDRGLTLVQEMVYWKGDYFYPASTIKLFAAVAAYEQINDLARAHPYEVVTVDTPLRFYPLFEGESVRETADGGGPITVERETHKLFVVSDNDAFNTLYDFVGQRDLNKRMWSWGVKDSMVLHRLSVARTEAENRRAPMVDVGLEPGAPQVGERFSTIEHRLPPDRENMTRGRGFMRNGELISEPFDFSGKNYATLVDLQLVLAKLLEPDLTGRMCCESGAAMMATDAGRPLDLTDNQRWSLIGSAAMPPRASESPRYDPAEYPDDHVKFLLPGLLKVRPLDEWRVVNKIGLAYGFVTENAFVEHRPTGRAVFVAAVIHRNPNGIYNDNRYDYETTLAEMATLGEVVGRALLGEASDAGIGNGPGSALPDE